MKNQFTLLKSLLVAMLLITSITTKAVGIGSLNYYLNTTNFTAYITAGQSSNLSGIVTIPGTVTYLNTTFTVNSISTSAFQECSGIKSFDVSSNSYFSVTDSVLFNADQTRLICYPRGKKSKSYSIPNTVTSIDSCAFYCTPTLNTLTIPASVKDIGKYAFYFCSYLKNVTIQDGVNSIGQEAFGYCTRLTSITIPNSVTAIKPAAFFSCSALSSINIPTSVTTIEKYAFSKCSGLTSVTIPNSVTSIAMNAFEYCSSITSLIIPNSVTSIATYAFEYCSSITSLIIPNSVTLQWGAFDYCSGLTSITIPNSSITLVDNAFSNCSKLAQIHCQAPTPTIYNCSSKATPFPTSIYNSCAVYVPVGSKTSYAAASPWKNFSFIMEENVTADTLFTVSASCNIGGTVSLGSNNETSITVDNSGSATLTITPNDGYKIASVKLNGVDITSGVENGSYKLNNVTANENFYVSFSEKPITLTISHADNASLRTIINKGSSFTYEILPTLGWTINTVTFNNQDVTSQLVNNSYTTPAITASSTLNISLQSPVSGVKALMSSNVKVYSDGSNIIITGAETGETITIYTVNGSLVKSFKVTSETMQVSVPSKDIYLVKMADRTVKVAVE